MITKKKEFGLLETKKFWDLQYRDEKTGWDVGYVSTPLKEYIDQLNDKNIKILIPGAGNAYEAEYLHLKGFNSVTVLDISALAIKSFHNRFPDFPEEHLLNEDYFNHSGAYDLIIEQTFFCAINPEDRRKYFEKMHSILNKNGKLVGVLFNQHFEKEGPPFGGTPEEYLEYFGDNFSVNVFDTCYNSIKPREGSELFINLKRK